MTNDEMRTKMNNPFRKDPRLVVQKKMIELFNMLDDADFDLNMQETYLMSVLGDMDVTI